MRQIRHMSVNIEGFLKMSKRKKLTGIFTDDNGNELSHTEAVKMLNDAQVDGWKLIPCGDCEGFDYFRGGCPGHEIIEDPLNQEP